jgi:F0F1-type ATP synthase membrane subunit b/b'
MVRQAKTELGAQAEEAKRSLAADSGALAARITEQMLQRRAV